MTATSPRYYSKSEFNLLFRDPKAWFRRYVLGEKVEPTPSMIEGRNFHAYIFHFYLSEFNVEFLKSDKNTQIPKEIHIFKGELRSKEAKEEYQSLLDKAETTGDLVLREKELESLRLMYHAIRENEFVHKRLVDCAESAGNVNEGFEVSLKANLKIDHVIGRVFPITGRLDGLYNGVVFDLKKVNSVDGGKNPDEFVKKAGLKVLFDYAFYTKLASSTNKLTPKFYFFVVNPPVISKGEVKTPARCFYVEPDSMFEETSMKALYDLLPSVSDLYKLEEEELASRIKTLLEGGVGSTPKWLVSDINRKVKDLKGLVK